MISLCAANSLASLSAVSVISATGNAQSAILMSDLPLLFEFATNVVLEITKTNALYVVARYVDLLFLGSVITNVEKGISDAFYCFECTRLEKDRDGCPKIINLGSSRTDLFYQYVYHLLSASKLKVCRKKNFRNH